MAALTSLCASLASFKKKDTKQAIVKIETLKAICYASCLQLV